MGSQLAEGCPSLGVVLEKTLQLGGCFTGVSALIGEPAYLGGLVGEMPKLFDLLIGEGVLMSWGAYPLWRGFGEALSGHERV